MKFGISTIVNDDTIGAVSLARAIEDRGFDSLVIAEHTNFPASRESACPLGGELSSIYYRTLDPVCDARRREGWAPPQDDGWL
jgi:alkanesulfonate monooxygenase SsuD/methylene tetrahydromethanopterin reductase-like flavin-dependent oxidoreductase (luciferase family)